MRKIRLKESDLHRVIREAIKSELGMTDKQKQSRRNARFRNDVDSHYDDPFEPNYSDRIDMEAPFHEHGWAEDKIASDRRSAHRYNRGKGKNGRRKGRQDESYIKRVVEQVINEMPSLDTGFSASEKAYEKALNLKSQYGFDDPRTRRADDQYKNIKRHYDKQKEDEMGNDEYSERRRINREVRNGQIRRGELNYVKGKGWRKSQENESLNRIVRESIKKFISESEDEFVPHGYYADSNWGGKEVQISDNGDAARFRRNYGTPEDPTDWLEIQYHPEREDFGAYCKTPWGDEPLSNYMRR